MPIRFRCGRCDRLLGIARRKAGCETTCPHCLAVITVPQPPPENGTELVDFEALLNPAAPTTPPPSSPREVPALHDPPPRPAPPPLPKSNDPPLFEQDLEEIFGELQSKPAPPERGAGKPPATSGIDAMSLGDERGHWVLNTQQATILGVVVLLMVILSFVAGYLAGSGR